MLSKEIVLDFEPIRECMRAELEAGQLGGLGLRGYPTGLVRARLRYEIGPKGDRFSL